MGPSSRSPGAGDRDPTACRNLEDGPADCGHRSRGQPGVLQGQDDRALALRTIVEQALDDDGHAVEIRGLLRRLHSTREEVISVFIAYDRDVFACGNEIYESLPIRVVLYLKSFMPGSWHIARQSTILRYIRSVHPKTLVDMGFGVPSMYVREYVLPDPEVKLTLVDRYPSAFRFAKLLLESTFPGWRTRIRFKRLDMNSHAYPGDYDVYLFQDSLEHVEGAEAYLSEIVGRSPTHAMFILSLPIKSPIPSHTVVWDNTDEVERWLAKCGLCVSAGDTIHPGRADLWAQQLKGVCDWIVMARRKASGSSSAR